MEPKPKPPHLAALIAGRRPPWDAQAERIERKQIAAAMRKAKERWAAERQAEIDRKADLESRRGQLDAKAERERRNKAAREEKRARDAEILAVLARERNWRDLAKARRPNWRPSGCEPPPSERLDPRREQDLRDSQIVTVRKLDRFDYDGGGHDATGELRALLARALARGR
jgi:hypothetical protein